MHQTCRKGFFNMNDKYFYLTSKYLCGEIAEAEQAELFAWVNESEVNKAVFEEMQELWSLSADIEEDFDTDVAVAWEKVAKRTITKDAKVIPYSWSKQLLRIAAVIFVVVGGYWLLDNWNQKPEDIAYQTATNEKTQITLPDGSKVWLNENTKIAFTENFDPRIVNLEGEAFFDVEHLTEDRPFEIRSGNTKITVLGTSFNVRAYPEESRVEVTVESGTVAFEKTKEEDRKKGKTSKVLLNKGDAGVFDKVEGVVNKRKRKMKMPIPGERDN